MPQKQPIAVSAVISLVLSALGCLGALPLAFTDYQTLAGQTAGVGNLLALLLALLLAALCMLGIIFGVVGLVRTRRGGGKRGRGHSWAGVLLGGVSMGYLVVLVLSLH